MDHITMYAWIRGERTAMTQEKEKAVYVLKETGKVCFVDFVTRDREATGYGWPNKICLGEVWGPSISTKYWDSLDDKGQQSWIAKAINTKD